MKRTLLIVVIALSVLIGAYGIAGAASSENPISAPPHTNFRQGYNGSCLSSTGAACHAVPAIKFMPSPLNPDPTNDYTNFCLSCHNTAGEAHQRNPGSPSTNAYINKTGFNLTGASGNSHAWGRPIGNAGTTAPTEANLQGYLLQCVTNGSKLVCYTTPVAVACSTCHNGMDKGLGNANDPTVREENIYWQPTALVAGSNYTKYSMNILNGYTTTKTYLKQYIRVYRAGSGQQAPSYERAKRQYLVNYTTYTYNNFSAMVIFHKPQPATASIYVDIPEPYLRQSNNVNAICYDCHADRVGSMATHPIGKGLKNSHPVSVQLQKTYGLNNTLMPTSKGNVFMERTYPSKLNNTVVCTSCHAEHNTPTNNGKMLREANDNTLCADCHMTKMYGYSSAGSVNYHNGYEHTNGANVCTDCHSTHNDRNVLLIKNAVNGKAMNFQNFSGVNSFGNDNGQGICEVCHTTTKYHLANGGGAGHNTGKNCLNCHKHSTGFQQPGVVGPAYCDTCHPYPGGSLVVNGMDWSSSSTNGHAITSDTVSAHMMASGYNRTTDTHDGICSDPTRCGRCHPSNPNHENGTIALSPNGFGNCNGPNFVIYTSSGTATCSDVKCHGAHKTTPNWN